MLFSDNHIYDLRRARADITTLAEQLSCVNDIIKTDGRNPSARDHRYLVDYKHEIRRVYENALLLEMLPTQADSERQLVAAKHAVSAIGGRHDKPLQAVQRLLRDVQTGDRYRLDRLGDDGLAFEALDILAISPYHSSHDGGMHDTFSRFLITYGTAWMERNRFQIRSREERTLA